MIQDNKVGMAMIIYYEIYEKIRGGLPATKQLGTGIEIMDVNENDEEIGFNSSSTHSSELDADQGEDSLLNPLKSKHMSRQLEVGGSI